MKRWLMAGLLLIPLVDVALLVVVAGYINWVPTIALVVLTALVGMLFVRAEGRHTLRRIQSALMRGDIPTNEVIDGGLLIAAGAFLLTPGLVTDLIGLLIVVPLTRIPIRMGLKRFVIVPMMDSKTGGFATGTVYTAGFPNDEVTGSSDFFGTDATGRSEEYYDVGPDAYEVEFEDDTDDRETAG